MDTARTVDVDLDWVEELTKRETEALDRKHARSLKLEAWQFAAVLSSPWPFLRGAIHTDGCRFINRTGRYEYPSYHFSNRSTDIAALVWLTSRRVGLNPRATYDGRRLAWSIRLNRREDVARLDHFVGPKS